MSDMNDNTMGNSTNVDDVETKPFIDVNATVDDSKSTDVDDKDINDKDIDDKDVDKDIDKNTVDDSTNGKEPNDEPGDDEPSKDDSDDDDEESLKLVQDDEGNLYNEDGELVAKKGDYELDEEGNVTITDKSNQEITRLSNLVKDQFGVDFTDESGNTIEFENTDEGFTELLKYSTKAVAQKEQAKLWNDFPEVKSYLQHKMAGGTDEDFYSAGNKYSNFEIPEETDDNKVYRERVIKDVIIERYISDRVHEGISDKDLAALRDEAEDFYEFKHAKGLEEEQANNDISWLKKKEQREKDERDAKNAQIIQQREESKKAFWGEIEQVVTNGDLDGINIPSNEREAFYRYMAIPVNDKGQSQEMIDRAKEDKRKSLQLSYFRFKNFNLSALVENKMKTEKVKQLRKQAAKKGTIIGKRSRKVVQKTQSNNITLGGMLGQNTSGKVVANSKNGISDID
jgi:hypothetical protein